MLTRYLEVMVVLAKAGAGATVGQVEKELPHLTRGQAERILKELITINFVKVEKVYYRPEVNKNVYHMTDVASSRLNFIVLKFNKTSRQKTLALDGEAVDGERA